MTDETIPRDACCKNCKYQKPLPPTLPICLSPKTVSRGFILHVDDSDVCRDWEQRGETEPVRNPYKLPHTCETCQHSIWDKDGCYCNRVPSKMHKVCETGTCEHWVLNQYIETNSEEMNK